MIGEGSVTESILIRGGEIIDGTGASRKRGDVW